MPLYDYRCEDCNHVFEAMHGIDEPPPTCPNCGSKWVKKIITMVSFKVDHGERLI
ncbi:MAG TPA: zinc ribbon domain-containing protein, partial [Candidatus Desulfofervidus auxilii]|nr:zinc ribbon domain-containing protein [Candidatus Desulfofervidus auxilii]